MIEDDVLVVGGGLAGMAAALAASETGASVRVLSGAESTLRQASGLIDVLGYAGGEGPLADPFDAIGDLPDAHPYRRVGADAVREGLALFDGAVPGYRGAHTDRNALVPTPVGRVKPTARYPASVAPGLASDARDCLLVGFEALAGFDAPLAAATLREAGVPFPVRGVTLRFPAPIRDDAARTRHARALDRDEGGVRSALAGAVASRLDGERRVGFPAVLGRDATREVRDALEAALGVPVFEVPTDPPSLPGLRLEDALRDALEEAGVRVTRGARAVGFEADGDRVGSVAVDRSGTSVPHAAGAFVLATGGLVGEGVRADRESVTEPVFGCHVAHPDGRYGWFAEEPFGEHPFARFGVAIDRRCRPLDADGEPEFRNLFAAGSVVAGADFAAEKSGSGVSLATGHVAGRSGGEVA